MKTLNFFFRHPHPIYFSMEKLFHALAEEIAKQKNGLFFVKEIELPFTSKVGTIQKNISFVRRSQAQINHITGDAQYAILGCNGKNINILTIHDCVLLYHYPKTSPRYWIIRWLWYRLPVKKADAVTVISENTKKDLLRFTHCPPGKIRVIPNFIDPFFIPIHKIFNEDRPELLFIGSAPNKNLERTIEAMHGLSIHLTIIGYPDDKQIQSLKNKNIFYQIRNKLSESEMRDAYGRADIIIFPSVHEGFGLPIIEAQATGRPVLTSRLEPMVSVAGGAACLVDPYHADSIRSGLLRIIGDESFRNELVERGFENVKRFQLSEVTRQYSDLYLELIEQKAS
jgi:glycosyltransferase involved in cell wall biosynthesis